GTPCGATHWDRPNSACAAKPTHAVRCWFREASRLYVVSTRGERCFVGLGQNSAIALRLQVVPVPRHNHSSLRGGMGLTSSIQFRTPSTVSSEIARLSLLLAAPSSHSNKICIEPSASIFGTLTFS